MPVLPEVASMSVSPGLIVPRSSARRIMRRAGRFSMPRSSGRNRKLYGEPRQAWLRGACHPSVSSEVTPRQETVDVAVQCAGGRSRENPLDRWGGAHTGIDRSLTLTADKGQEIAEHGARVGIPARCI